MLFILPLNLASWVLGVYATYHENIILYSSVVTINIILGVAILVFHLLSDQKVNEITCLTYIWLYLLYINYYLWYSSFAHWQ